MPAPASRDRDHRGPRGCGGGRPHARAHHRCRTRRTPPLNVSRLAQIIASGNQQGLRAADVQAQHPGGADQRHVDQRAQRAQLPDRTGGPHRPRRPAALAARRSARCPRRGWRSCIPSGRRSPTPPPSRRRRRRPSPRVMCHGRGRRTPSRHGPRATTSASRPSSAPTRAPWTPTSGPRVSTPPRSGTSPSRTSCWRTAERRPQREPTSSTTLKSLLGALDPASVPPGRVWVATQYAEMLDMITVTGLNGPAYFDINLSLGDYLPERDGRRPRRLRGPVPRAQVHDRYLHRCRRVRRAAHHRHPRGRRLAAGRGRGRLLLRLRRRRVPRGLRVRACLMAWITAADVETALGSAPVDSTYLAMCVDAANALGLQAPGGSAGTATILRSHRTRLSPWASTSTPRRCTGSGAASTATRRSRS